VVKLDDPRQSVAFVVRVTGEPGVGKSALAASLVDFAIATDEEVARLLVLGEDEQPQRPTDVMLMVVRGMPTPATRARVAELGAPSVPVLVAVHARDLEPESGDPTRDAWGEAHDPSQVYLTSTAPGAPAHGVDELRAALLRIALEKIEVPIGRALRAKRPYATAVIAGAALVSAAEGLLPGAAAFVVITQVGAIASLYYLYTGRFLARSQALSILPAFATEAAGGSLFLLAKSFLPPTGVADAIAAGVAASMTISILGAVTFALEQGSSLQEKQQLVLAFRRMNAKSRAERSRIVKNRHRWHEKEFWADLVRRVVFD
jgi:hypothetical protein